MTQSVSKFVSVILALLLLYIYPTAEGAKRQDDLSQIVVYNVVTQFVDAVRVKGYVTPTMYNDFLQSLHVTGNEYEVQMEHRHKKYHPEYSDAANATTFQDKYSVVYDGYYEETILARLFPESSLPKDSESRIYKMVVGDFFKVTVKNINVTPGTIMSDLLYGVRELSDGRTVIVFPYGGMVLNEDY
ncbi:hypothetical protein [Paenibacillus sp. IHBB 10380]|uniref:hypothetical protein n=1 Tax=Paenibacillus sp. IHBB 10380 TaxID=1566358 RepID=UPI0005CFB14C|nr:hypothetical protein [Paenibacillus sp. IHBB 10380]AJS58336.1 hypothetical protein UB51_07295 [Paenibacillus sp. IHBB 10380]